MLPITELSLPKKFTAGDEGRPPLFAAAERVACSSNTAERLACSSQTEKPAVRLRRIGAPRMQEQQGPRIGFGNLGKPTRDLKERAPDESGPKKFHPCKDEVDRQLDHLVAKHLVSKVEVRTSLRHSTFPGAALAEAMDWLLGLQGGKMATCCDMSSDTAATRDTWEVQESPRGATSRGPEVAAAPWVAHEAPWAPATPRDQLRSGLKLHFEADFAEQETRVVTPPLSQRSATEEELPMATQALVSALRLPSEEAVQTTSQAVQTMTPTEPEPLGFAASVVDPRALVPGQQQLVVVRYTEYAVELCTHAGGPSLGINADKSLYNSLGVAGIGEGLVAEWNAAHPHCTVQEGDQIVEVNGVRGNWVMLRDLCAKSGVLKIVLQRPYDSRDP